ncbi:hypothetical protein B7C51_20760 [Paenibacillus larvae subsp. pulvifaciens]|uniref:Oligopeptide-binding protein AppA n=1 Tax=Paenibacillus larvae subsp. pulvifaciens TaxID=1477 RepID=A0A1V0UXC9_9BACL|nr:hypothetical protein [Paenibacillus larvae]ARF69749.1 hypothetical protein B7C51_20760 [Paenibacillus larvae subsp. pulvifaciens]
MKKHWIKGSTFILAGALVLAGCSTDNKNNAVSRASGSPEQKQNFPVVPDGRTPAANVSKSPAAAQNRKDTVVSGLTTPEGVFNPYFYHNGYDGNASDPIFASLVDLDKDGKPYPRLAEKWDISDCIRSLNRKQKR